MTNLTLQSTLQASVARVREGAMHSPVFAAYEAALAPARARFAAEADFARLGSPDADPAFLELFLFLYCARGVRTTERVVHWIRGAGERCIEIGFDALGRTIIDHAKNEDGHHLMMIADAKALAPRVNARRARPLDPDALVALPPTPGAARYRKLHDDVIAGETPFGQVAIEYEISQLSVTVMPDLMSNCTGKLGEGIIDALSFLHEHITLDAGHTNLNARALGRVLELRPDALGALVDAGANALSAYAEFLRDVLCSADELKEIDA